MYELISAGANLEERNYFGETALHSAVRACQLEAIKFLLAEGADPQAKHLSADRRSRYELPVRFIDYSTMESVLDLFVRTVRPRAGSWNGKGMRFFVSELRQTDYGGMTPLHMAAERNHVDTVATILDAIGSYEPRTDGGLTALHLATLSVVDRPCETHVGIVWGSSGERETSTIEAPNPAADIERLIESGADLNARSDHGWTPLYAAVAAGNLSGVVALLDAGADLHARTETGFTPLHRAAFNGDQAMVSHLMEAGADPAAGDSEGKLPIHYARALEGMDVYWSLSDAQY